MAAGGERRMVFDLRGRRRHVVKAVYAVLAVLMGASLFLVVGPVNIGSLLGTGSSTSAGEALEEQATRIERRLRRSPNDPALLLALTRARISVANALAEVGPAGEAQQTAASREQLERAADSWGDYVRAAGGDVNPSAAQLAAGTFFTLAQTSSTYAEAERHIEAAAKAQGVVAERRPSVGSLATLAIYQYFSFDYAAAEQTRHQALAKANSKAERKAIEGQLDEVAKRAHTFQRQYKKAAKLEKSQGKQALENPFGALTGGGVGG